MIDTRTLTDDIAAVEAVVLYMYNTAKDEIFSVAYGETETFRHAPRYREEKIDMINKGGLEMLWGYLDSGGRARLIQAALAKYGKEVGRLPEGWRRDEDGTLHGDTGPLGTNEDVTDRYNK